MAPTYSLIKTNNEVMFNNKGKFALLAGVTVRLDKNLTIGRKGVLYKSDKVKRFISWDKRNGEWYIWIDNNEFKVTYQPLLADDTPLRKFLRTEYGISILRHNFIEYNVSGDIVWKVTKTDKYPKFFPITDGVITDVALQNRQEPIAVDHHEIAIKGGTFVIAAERRNESKAPYIHWVKVRGNDDSMVVKALNL